MITLSVIYKYLSPTLGESKTIGQQVRFCCPICDEGNKFNLEINLQKSIFNCWSCRYSGTLRKLFRERAVDSSWKNIEGLKHEREEQIIEKELNYPKETISFHLQPDVLKYLTEERNIPKDELFKRKVCYVYSTNETYYNHICFPFYEDGRLVGACLQDFKTKRYRNLGPLNFVPYWDFIDDRYPIILTEGVYDAMSVVNAIPMLRTEVNKEILNKLTNKDVILAVDNTVDISQYLRLMKSLEKQYVKSLVLFNMNSYKDLNEFHVKQPDGLINELRFCYKMIKDE